MSAGANPALERRWVEGLFAATFGGFLGLALLKFGNPPIMERFTTTPTNLYEFILGSPWPIAWAYRLLGAVALLSFFVAGRNNPAPLWLLLLPAFWLGWQLLATIETVAPRLSNPTLAHFLACVVCFYIGCFALSRVSRSGWFWTGLLCGFVLVLAAGWEQRFGGLEATRKYFFLYIYPQAKEVPPEYLKKLSSNRIFSTLFYPNALAGALLLLLPPTLGLLWKVRQAFTPAARWFLAVLIAGPALACLYWSGSKGGWLLMLTLGVVAFLWMPFGRRYKTILIVALLLLGGAGFVAKYAGFFRKGATSVVARFDYWHAALAITVAHPLIGSGPGTFAVTYEQIKRPEAEMSRLVHNDYLEQACESGFPGFLAYTGFVIGALIWSAPRRLGDTSQQADKTLKAAPTAKGGPDLQTDWLAFSVWLGLLGWAMQSLFEFDLYLPALAWPAFSLLGWSVGRTGLCRAGLSIDKVPAGRYSPPPA